MNIVSPKMPHVVIWLPTSIKACRELLQGVLRFVHLCGPWSIYILQETGPKQDGFNPKTWGCTGMIVDMRDRKLAQRLLSAGVPSIISHVPDDVMNPGHPLSQTSRLQCENRPIGIKAAEYFVERKFHNFAYIDDPHCSGWSEERKVSFCRQLAQKGYACHLYPKPSKAASHDFAKEQDTLSRWLASLPKPTALFAANDERGRQVLDSCMHAGIAVPQEIAVLGVDNDELICDSAHPQLSSIQMNTEKAGFEAARALDQMMRETDPRESKQVVIPFGYANLITRQSTLPIQTDDKLVAKAVEFMHINAGMALKVDQIAQHLNVSRRWLERRFMSVMGRTIHSEILRTKLDRVHKLLLDTNMSIESIAAECGFVSSSHLGTIFRRHLGTTPAVFRRKMREEHLSGR